MARGMARDMAATLGAAATTPGAVGAERGLRSEGPQAPEQLQVK